MEITRDTTTLKTQKNTSVPKINSIDPLADAKPVRLNKTESAATNQGKSIQEQGSASIVISPNKPTRASQTGATQQKITPQNPQTKVSPQAPQASTNVASQARTNALSKEGLVRIQQAKLQAQLLKRKQEMAQKGEVDSNTSNTSHASATEYQTHSASHTPKAANSTRPTTQNPAQANQANADKESPSDVDEYDEFESIADTEDRANITLEALQKNPNLQSLAVNVDNLDFNMTRKIRSYLKKLISVGGSDLHIKAGGRIRARINGDIIIFSEEIISKDDAITFAKELTRTRFPEFAANKEFDMTYIYDKNTRFRVNIFFQMDGVSFAFRRIPTTQSTISELGLPDAISNIVDMERGLVLVTGITGSGKSTTLAAIINEINQKHAKHIIAIEDPIEFVHKDATSIINQRSVGLDTNSFASALKSALREDPDIILVGEMRDVETTEMALHAAETGHLVLSTLHTLDAKETINRIISIFPTNDQHRIRATLASTLNAIISQRLLKTRNGSRTAAIELLFRTPRIELIINEGRDGEIAEALAEGRGIYRTQTFDQHLFDLVVDGVVDEEAAMEKATSPSDLKLRLQNTNLQDKGISGSTIDIKRQH